MSSLKSQNEALKRKTRLLEYSVHTVDDTLSTLKSPVLHERLAELIKVVWHGRGKELDYTSPI
jgi:hypothetical protein